MKKLDMKGLIDLYLDSKKNAWEATTLQSETARLHTIADRLDGNAPKLWAYMDEVRLGSYTRLTVWCRVTAFYDWLIEKGIVHGANPYSSWRASNARLFKNMYVRKTAKLSFAEAKERIAKIPDPASKDYALGLLSSGLRYCEPARITDGVVKGKGGKMRVVFGAKQQRAFKYNKSYYTFRRHLAEVGLKPHDLRKVFASSLVKNGANEFDLLEVMGWESLETAKSYVGARKKEELKKLVRLATIS